METIEARKLMAMLVAGYPGWKATEETLRLYAGSLEPLDYSVTCEVLKSIIESPREFAPPIGLITSNVRARMEIAERDRRLALPCKHPPGEVRYDPKGRKYVADTWGDLRLERPSEPMEDLNSTRRAL
jgi:hypothetical protein